MELIKTHECGNDPACAASGHQNCDTAWHLVVKGKGRLELGRPHWRWGVEYKRLVDGSVAIGLFGNYLFVRQCAAWMHIADGSSLEDSPQA